MSVNLLDLVQSQLGGGIMGQIAGALGESEEGTSKAMGAAMPALLGGIMQKAKGDGNANFLMDMISSGGHDGGVFDKLPGMLGGGGDKGAGLMNMGGPILDNLLGDKLGGVMDMVGAASGLGKDSTSGIMKMAAPLMMGTIGKQVSSGGLDAGGLMGLLGNQGGFLKGAAPAGLAGLLGLGKIDDLLGGAFDAVKGAAGAAMGVAGDAAGAVGDAAGAAADAGKAAAGAAAGAAGAAADAVSGAAGAAADAGKAAAGVAAGAVGDAAGAAANLGKSAAGAAGNAAGAAVDGAGEVAKSGGNLLMKLLPIALIVLLAAFLLSRMGCKSDVGDAAEGAVDGASSVVSGAAGAIGDAADGAVDLAGDAAGAVGDAAEGAANLAGDAADAVGDAAGAVVDAAGDAAGAVGDAANATGGRIAGAIRSIKLPTGGDLEIKGGSTEDQLYTYLDDASSAVGQSFTFDDLRFEKRSPNLETSSHGQLDRVVAILNAYPNVKFRVEGHTDNVGDAEVNMNLSRARAENTKNYLLKQGIKTTRVTTKGYGDTKPIASNDTEEGRAQNRRVVLIISEK